MQEAKLELNEEEIELNGVMQAILANITLGFVKSLKNIPSEIKSINILINLSDT